MTKKQYWYTQEILFLTEHFGKKYFYMKDVDGHIYAVPAKPVVKPEAYGSDDVVEASGYVPDFTR